MSVSITKERARMPKLKTRNKQFVCFEGIDVIKAREALGLTQREMARICFWGINFQVRHEQPVEYIVIPDNAHIIHQSTFELLLEALTK